MSANAEATAAFKAGVQAVRDGSLEAAKEELDRAVQLDGHFAAARLRRALLPQLGSGMDVFNEQRQDALEARKGIGDLGEIDRVLLDSTQPWMDDPPDVPEARRRYEAAVKKYPSDAELQFLLAAAIAEPGKDVQAYDESIGKDPKLAVPWAFKARSLAQSEDTAGAVAAYERCIAISPAATSCLEGLGDLQAASGKCEELAATARKLVAVAPNGASGYGLLARALFSLGQPADATLVALKQRWERLPRGERRGALDERAGFAILTGNFDEAIRVLEELERDEPSSPSEPLHFYPAYNQIVTNLEVGRAAKAREIERRYMRERTAWQPYEFGPELTIRMYPLQIELDDLTAAQALPLREAWRQHEEERRVRIGMNAPGDVLRVWAYADAAFVTTPAEASAALARRPDVPVMADTLVTDTEAAAGHTYLLGSRLDDAIAVLGRVTRQCVEFDPSAIVTVRATLDLGRALDAKGDAAAACAAYQRVLTRWGHASSPSQTAAAAAARARSLRCAP